MTTVYTDFTGEPGDFVTVAREARREVLKNNLGAELGRSLRLLERLSKRNGAYTREADSFREALIEIIVCFPAYRTYLQPGKAPIGEDDRRRIEEALARAKISPGVDVMAVDFVGRVLMGNIAGAEATDFTAQFQQVTGPAMAKGVEDCAFYRYNRLVALNEVGGNPAQFGTSIEAFHQYCLETVPRWAESLLTMATHDTKRSGDVRARLYLLSEISDAWSVAVRSWSVLSAPHRQGHWPDRNTEYLFYQTLVGAWPWSLDRALAYMEKAVREAGEHTGWTRVSSSYESALKRFITGCFSNTPLMRKVEEFVGPLIEAGYINSLAQTLLTLTAPGVADIYQGAELWDLSLVDPDR